MTTPDERLADEVLAVVADRQRQSPSTWSDDYMEQLARAVKRLTAELATVREELRVEELESAHWLSLACDDPGKNPPLFYKSLYETERAARIAAEGRMRTDGTMEVCLVCKSQIEPAEIDIIVEACQGALDVPCPIRSARGA